MTADTGVSHGHFAKSFLARMALSHIVANAEAKRLSSGFRIGFLHAATSAPTEC